MLVNAESSFLSSTSSLRSLSSRSSSSFNSDYFDIPTPPLSPSCQVPLTPPISMTADPVKFTLDLSFNRHGSNTNMDKRFACSIDPLAPLPSFQRNRLNTSHIDENATHEQWKALYGKWSFPIRTDSPRGLTWGPYHIASDIDVSPSTSIGLLSSRGTKRSRTSSNAENDLLATEPKRQRLIPILRLPRKPLIVRLVMAPPQIISQLNSTETMTSCQTPTTMTCVETLTKVIVSAPAPKPLARSRITLSRSSKLKYGL
ncbi:hypothetical protein DFH28DRAFT_899092 [Melampsora americana]|nr:hypothetical protein DFH28DRAFT_899092 [Melampsora americana]